MYKEHLQAMRQAPLLYPHNKGIQDEFAYKWVKGFAQVVALNATYDKASDVEQIALSLKSNHFTLASGNLMQGNTLEEMVDYYIATTASARTAYITKQHDVFYMNHKEFKQFLMLFARLERDSERNGGKMKVRMRRETKAMLAWLNSQASQQLKR